MAKPSSNASSNRKITMFVPETIIERAEKEALRLSSEGLSLSYTDVLRMAMVQGLESGVHLREAKR